MRGCVHERDFTSLFLVLSLSLSLSLFMSLSCCIFVKLHRFMSTDIVTRISFFLARTSADIFMKRVHVYVCVYQCLCVHV